MKFKVATKEVISKLGLWKRSTEVQTDPLTSFFYSALCQQDRIAKEGWGNPPGVYYEFGVGWGGTLASYITALKHFCRENGKDMYSYRIFGFDSFAGLPEKSSRKDDHPIWQKNSFAHSVSEIEKRVKGLGYELGRGSLRWIEGYFESTLTPKLQTELRRYPPSIVTVDVDYHSSTKAVLNWLRPILMNGVLLYFDDIWAFHGDPGYGQLAAITESNKRGTGKLVPFPVLGMPSRAYIYYTKKKQPNRR